jgi:hypothetical protein
LGLRIDNCRLKLIVCPFCKNHIQNAKPGMTTCPECSAEFEVDDRLECIFINPDKLRLPMAVNGTVCGVCGLVQGDEVERCGYCGVELSAELQ